MEIIVLGLIASVSLVSWSLYRRARAAAPLPPPEQKGLPPRRPGEEPTLDELRPGDVLQHFERDWLIEGVLVLDDDGKLLRLFRLLDAGEVRWLAVRPGGGDDPLFLAEVDDLDVPFDVNAPDQLVHAGVPYRLSARARIRVTLAGAGPRLPGDRAHLYEYAGAGGRRLVAVAWTARSTAFVGAPVTAGSIEVLPGG